MYCNQCGYEMKDSANFCKKCGAPIDDTNGEISERKRRVIKFLYIHKSRILLCFIGVLVLCGITIGAFVVIQGMGQKSETGKKTVLPVKAVNSVDLKDSYTIEDNRLVLEPLHATYDDGTVHELTDYTVFIDTVLYKAVENAIDAKDLYDGKHLVRLEWMEDGTRYEFEKTVNTEHKKDTWEKYVDLIGMTGKEIAAAYGEMETAEFGTFQNGDWGYAYVNISSLSIQACFPTGVFNKEQDFQESDSTCVEMTGTLNTFFYNLESEMSIDNLADILGLTLMEAEGGGCSGTLPDGKLLSIGVGQVQDGIYTPDTAVKVSLSEAEQEAFWERLF